MPSTAYASGDVEAAGARRGSYQWEPAPGKTALWIFVRKADQRQLEEIITLVMPPGAELPIAVIDLVGTPRGTR